MRAVQLTGFGGLEMLRYREDTPVPRPAAHEVRVRVTAAGVNNTDVWTREGAYGSVGDGHALTGWRRTRLEFPRTQGADVAGHIDAVGARVSSDRVGERVLIDPMLYIGGEPELVNTGFLGSERDGGFAEWVTVPAMNAHRVDSGLTDAELSTFPTAYATALRMLGRASVQPCLRRLCTSSRSAPAKSTAAERSVGARDDRVEGFAWFECSIIRLMSTTWRKSSPSARNAVDTVGRVQRDVRIRGDAITLGQLLKLEGVIGSGSEVKAFVSTEPVWVNGEPEARRGRKLHLDDVVRVGELVLRVASAAR